MSESEWAAKVSVKHSLGSPSAVRRDNKVAHGIAVGNQEEKELSAVGAAQTLNRIRIADRMRCRVSLARQ
jgi:hypothetical protein